ncbi:hypothetical protein ACFL6I_25735 [candidate division KSB1 bacterium]
MKKKYLLFGGIILLVLIIAFAAYASYYVKSIKSVEVRSAKVTAIKNISLEGFTVEGEIGAYNPSLIDIKTYDSDIVFSIKGSDEKIGVGKIKAGVLQSKSETNIQFSQHMDIPNLVDLAKGILEGKKIIILVEGDIHISEFFDVSIPFSTEYDISSYLEEYAGEKINQFLDSISGFFG